MGKLEYLVLYQFVSLASVNDRLRPRCQQGSGGNGPR